MLLNPVKLSEDLRTGKLRFARIQVRVSKFMAVLVGWQGNLKAERGWTVMAE